MKVIIPCNKTGFHRHTGDTFRELVTLWQRHGQVEIELSSKTNFCWLNEIGDTLLYDRPTMEWYYSSPEPYQRILFGNEVPQGVPNSSSWIFWPRSPRAVANNRNECLAFGDRNIESIFIGKIENNVQSQFRMGTNWNSVIEVFDMIMGNEQTPYRWTQEQYLDKIKHAKFGLCLRGFGPKCNREIEYLAMGTVPVFTKEVDNTYFEPLEEGEHFIRVESPEEFLSKTSNMSEWEWTRMSINCLKWYDRNAGPHGSFNTTMKIVEKLQDSGCVKDQQTIKSFCTMATKNSASDLDMLLYSWSLWYPNTFMYILCDSYIYATMKDKYSKSFNITFTLGLDKYKNMTRKEMESQDLWLDFMLEKCNIIDEALSQHNNTIFVDSDIILLNKIEFPHNCENKIGLCPHMIRPNNEKLYGKYNGGMMFISDQKFTKWWKEYSRTDKTFYEQYPLTYADKHFPTFNFKKHDDYGWWRMYESTASVTHNQSEWTIKKNEIYVADRRLSSIHTHLLDFSQTNKFQFEFNKFIINLLNQSPSFTNKLILAKYNEIKTKLQQQSDKKLNILVQYHNDSNKERQREINYCFLTNLLNENIKKVFNFKEKDTKVPKPIQEHPKYVELTFDHRLTYRDAFDFANTQLHNEYCCILNNDIYVDKFKLDGVTDNVVGCISRFEYNGGEPKLDPLFARLFHCHTQDAWIFQSPKNINNCNFSLGKLGCDNAIAHRIKQSGYLPMNLSQDILIVHYDEARDKNSQNFMSKHREGEFPEKEGYYLLPSQNIQEQTFDEFKKMMQVTDEEVYTFYCDIITKRIKIDNRPQHRADSIK